MAVELTPEQRVVLGHLKTIAKILLISGVVATAAILARLLGREDLDSSGFKAPLRHIWLFFVPATIAHVFWTRFAVYAIDEVRKKDTNQAAGIALLDEVRSSESIFLRGLIPRTSGSNSAPKTVEMSLRDPTTWISYGLVIAVVVAILPWRIKGGQLHWDGGLARVVTLGAVALVLTVANWMSGSLWIATLSQLTVPKSRQWAFQDIPLGSTAYIRWRFRIRWIQILFLVALVALVPFVLIKVV